MIIQYLQDRSILADIGFAIIWQLVTIHVIVCASRIAKQLFPGCTGAPFILHTTVLSIAICLVGLFAVGGVGLLSAWSAIGTVSIIGSVANWFVLQYWTNRPSGSQVKEQMDKPVVLFWFVAFSLFLGNVIANGLLRWPSEWDNLMYHLPFIDHWIQNGTLAATQSARWSMPASSELLGLWFAIPFSGDFLVALNNVPVVVVFVAALIELGRSMGMTGWFPHVCAFVCICTQVTIRQSTDASNDLMVGAYFFAGLFYFRKLEHSQLGAPILLGICIGMLVGTKYFAIGYGVILAAVTALWFARSNAPIRRDNKIWLGFAATITLIGGYWFFRNWTMTGNPIFPIGSKEFAERLPYPGIHRTTLLFHLTEEAQDLVLASVWKRCGPFHVIALAAIPSFVIWMCFDNTSRAENVRRGILVAIVGCLAILLTTPMLVEDQPGTMNHLRWGYTTVRYGLCFWTFVTFLFFLGINSLSQLRFFSSRPFLMRALFIVVPIQIYWTVMNLESFFAYRTLLWGLAGGLWLATHLLMCLSSSRGVRYGIEITLVLLHCYLIGILSDRWHRGLGNHFDRYSQSDVFTSLGKSPKSLLVLNERSYPFFGSYRQNHIVQPMMFYDVNRVWDAVISGKIDVIATQEDASNEIARYRSAGEALEQDARFEAIDILKNGGYRLFRPNYSQGFNRPSR